MGGLYHVLGGPLVDRARDRLSQRALGHGRPATRDYSPGPEIWTLWHYDMVLEPGAHTLQVRCTTLTGSQSDPSSDDSDYDDGYGGSELVTFNVT